MELGTVDVISIQEPAPFGERAEEVSVPGKVVQANLEIEVDPRVYACTQP